AALEASWRDGHDPAHREHVDEYVYEHPERFRILRVDAPPELRRPEYRLTLDTPDDLALFAAIVEHFPGAGFALDLREVVALLDREPRLADMNRHIVQKTAR